MSDQMKASPPSQSESRFEDADRVILLWDASNLLLWDDAAHMAAGAEYLASVDEIIAVVGEGGYLCDRAGRSLQMAMSCLEDEFAHLMSRSAIPLDFYSLSRSLSQLSLYGDSDGGDTDDLEGENLQQQPLPSPPQGRESLQGPSWNRSMVRRNVNLVLPEALDDLKAIVDRMILAGYGFELGQVYCCVRREIIDEYLSSLGMGRLSIEEVQKIESPVLEDDEIKHWIHAMKIVFFSILHGEKQLGDYLLAASEELREECFAEMAKCCVLRLLNFWYAIVIKQTRSIENISRILDMYEALSEVLPEMQDLFSSNLRDVIGNEFYRIQERLHNAVNCNLLEFANTIKTDSSRGLMQTGDIHPLTRFVMNYIGLLVVYSNTLETLLYDDSVLDGNSMISLRTGGSAGYNFSPVRSPVDGGSEISDHSQYNLATMSPLGRLFYDLILLLELNLEEKSKFYKDKGLEYIFRMNNLHYIVQEIKNSELGMLLGDQWIKRRGGFIRQYSTSYFRASWSNLLNCITDQSSGSNRDVSKVAVKEKFKSFNLAFEEIYKAQIAWKVPDLQLREELRISISDKVIPAYHSFSGRFSGQLGRDGSRYFKYTVEDLESTLSDFFEGRNRSSSFIRFW